MADIKLVINISEDSYKALCNGWMLPSDVENVINAIKNGKVLPKGHGRLIDADRLAYDCGFDNGYGCERICHCDNCTYHMVKESEINNAKTLVEADKGEEK